MSNDNKKMVEAIASINEDFTQWYTDICKKAELVDYSSVKGCVIMRPYGYAIWENIQKILDKRFKETGHDNVAMPMFIPESLLQKEKDHVIGFAPEVAWVTHGGSEKLEERLCVRPTSETLFCDHWSNVCQSYRDLPMKYNQWCSVVRWEKTTRPFLRGREFWWQEGHTIHETAEEAISETKQMLDVYAEFCENSLMIPVVKGQKTEKEKFAGAISTYAVEAMMHDGKALQSGTSHYFGDGFCKAFDVKFTGRENKLEHPHETSWGVSTRLIGAIIMTHGDDNGLVLPSKIAPYQIVIVPIMQKKAGVLEKADEIKALLSENYRVKIDDTDNSPGWKFSQWEMKGVPLRLEIGPKDIEKNQCVIVRRDNREKTFVSLDNLQEELARIIKEFDTAIYNKAMENRKAKTDACTTWEDIINTSNTKTGYIKTMWCGSLECEEKMKSDAGLSSRCIPYEQEHLSDTCPICNGKADKMVLWGKAY